MLLWKKKDKYVKYFHLSRLPARSSAFLAAGTQGKGGWRRGSLSFNEMFYTVCARSNQRENLRVLMTVYKTCKRGENCFSRIFLYFETLFLKRSGVEMHKDVTTNMKESLYTLHYVHTYINLQNISTQIIMLVQWWICLGQIFSILVLSLIIHSLLLFYDADEKKKKKKPSCELALRASSPRAHMTTDLAFHTHEGPPAGHSNKPALRCAPVL